MSPTVGIEYKTKFYVSGFNFNDTDDSPSFRYKFGYQLDSDKMITWFYEGSKIQIPVLYHVIFLGVTSRSSIFNCGLCFPWSSLTKGIKMLSYFKAGI